MSKKGERRATDGSKGRAGERFFRRIGMPCDLLPGGSLITVRGRGEVAVGGGKRIIEYTRESIRIALSNGEVLVRGHGLECISYHVGQMSVEGVIDSVEFLEGDEK